MLTRVTETCSRVGSIHATPELMNDPEAFAKFQAAQGDLFSALSGCGWCPRIIRNGKPTPTFAPTSRNWRVPKTASR